MNTSVVKNDTNKFSWHLIDASTKSVGRVATEAARLLIGKDKPTYTPTEVCGDKVVIINSDNLVLTGKKTTDKSYFRHSGYADGLKERNAQYYLDHDSTFIIRNAIEGMLPKNRLRSKFLNNLYIYKDDKHKHSAQLGQS